MNATAPLTEGVRRMKAAAKAAGMRGRDPVKAKNEAARRLVPALLRRGKVKTGAEVLGSRFNRSEYGNQKS